MKDTGRRCCLFLVAWILWLGGHCLLRSMGRWKTLGTWSVSLVRIVLSCERGM
jgi:hypothetical protein